MGKHTNLNFMFDTTGKKIFFPNPVSIKTKFQLAFEQMCSMRIWAQQLKQMAVNPNCLMKDIVLSY